MDIAYYVSELLLQNGEVNVPGLGYFVQLKVAGYYDDTQKKIYPPGSITRFDPQYHDDDVLLQYIAEKRKISLASSKYFTAKFIDNLRQEAMIREVPIAKLGTIYFEDNKLHFKPAEILPADPANYGYRPIAISKLGGTSFREQMEKEMPQPAYVNVPPLPIPEPAVPIGAPPVNEQTVLQTGYNTQPPPDHEEEFIFHGRGYSDEPEEKDNNWIWITITAVVVLGIVGVFALYKFKPAMFNRLRGAQTPAPLVLKTPLRHDSVKAAAPAVKVDTTTIKTKTSTADTIAKPASVNTQASGIDSTKVRFEVIGTSTESLHAAYKAVENYKTLGIEAHVVDPTPGKRRFKVSLGTYATHAEAVDAINTLVKSGKVKPGIWPLPINPKK